MNPLSSIPVSSTPAAESSPENLPIAVDDRAATQPSPPISDAAIGSEFQSTSISLLEERLKVSYQRRKIGEVVIHKRIETRMIEVPVRYEKLIIEQISPELKQLAEVDLAGDLSLDASLVELRGSSIVRGEFVSPRFASQVLYELGKTLPHQCKRVSIEIELEDSSLTEAYQQRLDQFIDTLKE